MGSEDIENVVRWRDGVELKDVMQPTPIDLEADFVRDRWITGQEGIL